MLFNVYMYIVFIYLFTYTLFLFDYSKSGPSYIHHLKASPLWLWRPKYFDPVFDGWNTNQEVPNLQSHICSDMKTSNFREPSSRWRISSNGEDVTFYWSIVLPHGDMKRNATNGWGDESGWRFLFHKICGAASPKSLGFELSFYRFFSVFCCGRFLHVERFWIGSKGESLLNARIRIYCQILEW